MDYYLTIRDIDQFDDLVVRDIPRLDKARIGLPVNRNVRFSDISDYHLTAGEIDRFDGVRVSLHGDQYVLLNTVDDGSQDVVRIVSEQVRSDVASVASKYGKYVVYGVAGLLAFQLGKLWWRYRKRR